MYYINLYIIYYCSIVVEIDNIAILLYIIIKRHNMSRVKYYYYVIILYIIILYVITLYIIIIYSVLGCS